MTSAMRTEPAPVHGLVLAGGRSRRMGRDKAALVIRGETQLARAVALLERHLAEVYVSVRGDQEDDPARAGYRLIVDRYDDLGPAAGILSAFDADPGAAWLVLACDLPNVDDEAIAALVARRRTDAPAVAFASSHDGLPEPLCALWLPASARLLRDAVAEGVSCPRKVLIRAGVPLLEQPRADALDNVNTPDDLSRVAGGA